MRCADISSKTVYIEPRKRTWADAPKIPGRIQLDLLNFIWKNEKPPGLSLKLNDVSKHFLGLEKEDIHFSIINKLQSEDSESRRRLAVYCLKVFTSCVTALVTSPLTYTDYRMPTYHSNSWTNSMHYPDASSCPEGRMSPLTR